MNQTDSPAKALPPITNEIERGFASSADPVPSYYVYMDDENFYFSLACICGQLKAITPKMDGTVKYNHKSTSCGFKGTLILKDFEKIFRKKK